MRSVFGWSLPPGCSMQMIDRLSEERPCAVCGQMDCLCPECPECGGTGDPVCYERHGLVRNAAQIAGAEAAKQAQAAEQRQAEMGDDPADTDPPERQ
jgi:hypothetical protein